MKKEQRKPIVELKDVRKVYIMGKNRNAKKANQAIRKFSHKTQKLYTKIQKLRNCCRDCCRAKIKKLEQELKAQEKILSQAQTLFSGEKYRQAYRVVTGKQLKLKQARGVVVHALNGVNLGIYPGEFVAIMGPSGSGKSTLLNMIGCLDRPSHGSVWIDGLNVTEMPRRSLPKIRLEKVGFVFQSFNLLPTMTALENVMMALRYKGGRDGRKKKQAVEILRKVGLGDRLDHRPTELSGGQSQRVAIARALVNKPAIILADEPTGELDSKTSKELVKIMKDLNRKLGQTFIIVTHDEAVTKEVDRVIKVKDGKVS
jgi:ABC-type lipoprotein export system ATPase subunit